MWNLPSWLPYVEISFNAGAVALNTALLYLILTSQLHTVCRALFCTNVVAVLISALAQAAINVWIIVNGRQLGRNEFFFFPYVVIHQIGYYMCACSFLLIIGERFLLCFNPRFYERRTPNFFICFSVAFVVEICITLPVVTAMQYDSLNISCSSFVAGQEAVSLLLLQICNCKSKKFYRTKFATVNLNCRFEVRGVIEVTTAILPICAMALLVKAFFFVLTFFAHYGDDTFISDTHFMLRLACIAYGYTYPVLLVARVKTFRRRFYDILPTVKVSFYNTNFTEEAEVSTRRYFEQLASQWN